MAKKKTEKTKTETAAATASVPFRPGEPPERYRSDDTPPEKRNKSPIKSDSFKIP
jgi:hypothetical protein